MSSSGPRMLKMASRARSIVGRVVMPRGAVIFLPRRRPAITLTASPRFDLRPHLAPQLLSRAVLARDEARCARRRDELPLLPERREYGAADEVGTGDGAAHRLATEAEEPRRIHRPEPLHGLGARARLRHVDAVDVASLARR